MTDIFYCIAGKFVVKTGLPDPFFLKSSSVICLLPGSLVINVALTFLFGY